MMERYVIEDTGSDDLFGPIVISEVDDDGTVMGSLGHFDSPEEAKAAHPEIRWKPARKSWQPDALWEGVAK